MTKADLQFALAYVFGEEWYALTTADRTLIERDCTEEGGVSDLQQYRRNIGRGNLAAYVGGQRIPIRADGWYPMSLELFDVEARRYVVVKIGRIRCGWYYGAFRLNVWAVTR